MKTIRKFVFVQMVAVLLNSASVRAVFTPAPTTIIVTNSADSGTGTLRDAIARANDGDTIVFSLEYPATITLTSGQLLVSNSLTISGPGPTNLAVSGNYTNRVIGISPGAEVTISGLTFTNGSTTGNGGGIYNDHASLILSNCAISGNKATWGGGIYVGGSSGGSAVLQIINCTLSDNSAYLGGGIYSDTRFGQASVQISNSVLSRNSAYFSGGGIFSGGVAGSATLEINNSILSSNSAGISDAGGIVNVGFLRGTANLEIISSIISDNSAGKFAGGILNNAAGGSASARVINCTLSDNSAIYAGGGIYNAGGSANLLIVNSTLAGNSTTLGYGGGVANNAGAGGSVSARIVNSTLSSNSAVAGGGIANYAPSVMEIGSTILDAGQAGSNIVNFSGMVNSLGYNLSGDDAAGLLTNTTDRINSEPKLGPLQDNGGPTFTQAPLAGSPAIDQGYNFTGGLTDQRGFARPYDKPGIANATGGDGSDIGAVEVQDWPPVADAGATRMLIISRNCTNATFILNGTRSSDPDGDLLQYRWYEAGAANPLADGAVAIITLPVGAHPFRLVVDDGKLTDTNDFSLEIITPAEAVDRLITTVKAKVQHPQALLAELETVAASFRRKNHESAVNELHAFQNKVRAQVKPYDPALADNMFQSAQQIIDALSRRDPRLADKPSCKLDSCKRRPDGCFHLEFSGAPAQRYIVEASTNLADWAMIGVVTAGTDGSFAFEDAQATMLPSRFYRVIEAPQ